MLNSKGSSGTCIPEGRFRHSYSALSWRTRKPSKVYEGPCAMTPPVQAMMNALKHCRGCTPPNLDAI
jgi:hypothetical protein